MDTSQQYVDMCRKAVEIQDREIPTIGVLGDPRVLLLGENTWWFDRKGLIFLPRQDQLQDMVGNFELCMSLAYELGDGCSEGYSLDFSSFEQLWLGIVMHEKYGKTWTGSDWE